MLRHLTILLSAMMVVAVLNGCGQSGETADTPPQKSESVTQKPELTEADFENALFTGKDLQGNLRSSNEWIGKKPTMVNIWGTWCPPCRAEIPDMVKLYEEYKSKGLEIIGIAVNDTPEKVATFAEQSNMNWVLLIGNTQEIAQTFRTNSVPTTLFFDRHGNLMQVRQINPQTGEKFLQPGFKGPQSYEVFKETCDSLLSI